ncbi:hypothetical protein [Yinghuangia sp. YIM S10712]|uniref:hypothetical protein n=1 Tax=Yinghuangia sp. YIM S10712 TaxID=3436930 RepID=UPI003F531891
MDIKKLTRGDAVVALAALLIFIFSFLAYFETEYMGQSDSVNAWDNEAIPGAAASLVLVPVVAAILFIVGGLQPRPVVFLGLNLRQWATPLAVVSPLYAIWTIAGGPEGIDAGIGAIFILLATLILAGAVIATEMVPALKAPLGLGGGAGAGAPQGGAPYGGQPAGGFSGAPQGGAPYGGSQPGQFGGAQAAPAGAAAAPAADPSFQPYWFSVPDQRELVDAQTNAPTGSLNPGVWYLAVAQHGQGLLVEVDGVRGVLWNVSGIQKS